MVSIPFYLSSSLSIIFGKIFALKINVYLVKKQMFQERNLYSVELVTVTELHIHFQNRQHFEKQKIRPSFSLIIEVYFYNLIVSL